MILGTGASEWDGDIKSGADYGPRAEQGNNVYVTTSHSMQAREPDCMTAAFSQNPDEWLRVRRGDWRLCRCSAIRGSNPEQEIAITDIGIKGDSLQTVLNSGENSISGLTTVRL